MSVKHVYRIGEIVDALHISRRRILLYVEKGLIRPSFPSEGRGKAAFFSIKEVCLIYLVDYLQKLGLTIRAASCFIDDSKWQWDQSCFFLNDGPEFEVVIYPSSIRDRVIRLMTRDSQ